MKCILHYLTDMQEVILFYNGLNVPTRQILDLKGVVPIKTAADAKVQILQKSQETGQNRTITDTGTELSVQKLGECYQRTFYWVDPELPSDYYKQEVYKLIQKDKQLKEENYILNGKIRELQKEFDFEKSTLEKQVLMLQMELKESKSCLVFYRKVVVVMTLIMLVWCFIGKL
ncbi:hypothetical protein Tco_0271509 [Tanacetum coccineum]